MILKHSAVILIQTIHFTFKNRNKTNKKALDEYKELVT